MESNYINRFNNLSKVTKSSKKKKTYTLLVGLNVVECEDELALVCNDIVVEVEQPNPSLEAHARCIVELQNMF